MEPLFLGVILPGSFALGALLAFIVSVQALFLVTMGGAVLWGFGALLGGMPLGAVFLRCFCLVVAVQVGYGAALTCRGVAVGRQRRKPPMSDADGL